MPEIYNRILIPHDFSEEWKDATTKTSELEMAYKIYQWLLEEGPSTIHVTKAERLVKLYENRPDLKPQDATLITLKARIEPLDFLRKRDYE